MWNMKIRSFLFTMLFALTTFLVAILFFPFLVFRCQSLYWAGYIWSKASLFLLKHICGIDYKIEGQKNIPNKPYLIASKHQSVFETIVFWSMFYIPTFILKKELLSVPFFGIYLKSMKMIAIDRRDGRNSLKKRIVKSAYHLQHKRNIIIFPEGTRTDYGTQKESYSPGVAALYTGTNVPVLPIALNSGKFWPNNGDKKPGTITIKILPPIAPGLDRKVFLKKLYESIESSSKKL